jgi:NAD-reducing hydrogenase large subunit
MLNLETAQAPHKLRRVAIEPVTRVEGHGKVTILLDEENRIHQVRLHIVEFRGFEIFIRGRPYWEVPIAVQRLCGICPVSHLLAATKAMDLIAGYGPLTPTAEKLRRLLHYGQVVQSHALHFFHLSSPDLLFGFESEVAKRNIFGVAQAFPDLAKQGIMTRKFGQQVIQHIAGKRIHGTGVIPPVSCCGALGRPARGEVDPDLCVAMRAAIQGAAIAGQKVSAVLVDVTPYTFGTSALDYLDGGLYPHRFVPIIPKNTPIPVRKSEAFRTVNDNQKVVEVRIYQGESEDALENVKIGVVGGVR